MFRQDARRTRTDGRTDGRSDARRPMGKRPAKFHMPKGTKIDYKDINLLQKYISDRGKILSRRVTGVSSSEQRALVRSIKQARFLGLLTILGARRE